MNRKTITNIISTLLLTGLVWLGMSSGFFDYVSSLGQPNPIDGQTSQERPSKTSEQTTTSQTENQVNYNQAYLSKDEVAAYLDQYDELPPNYLTKQEAQDLGWRPELGNLWEVTDHGAIGGDHFGNFEAKLPENEYREADVNYTGGSRNSERLVYSKDGDIYYTPDHYDSFDLLYEGD
ncbi:hypothetical protein AWM75_03820 [Aerococcus urinaehominis]|uniref:Ribonuclease n=1 Tax=Aerococcus urinaehominis TaxID=128944 RepID=A0A109RH01_9LACT|nr:ribonuclease domain-containing protein [Aerococcus urinaehominis]AMB99186.1 hypothetical protein AWM75_03820 [Aerococcus urinaehominis]SDM06758.1 ribonuclease [Aerococcus urinaehominis]